MSLLLCWVGKNAKQSKQHNTTDLTRWLIRIVGSAFMPVMLGSEVGSGEGASVLLLSSNRTVLSSSGVEVCTLK